MSAYKDYSGSTTREGRERQTEIAFFLVNEPGAVPSLGLVAQI